MYKILVVEDDYTISSIIGDSLKKWGYDARRTTDFRDILSQYNVYEPHLILMDINLPYYDGFYWCTKIRELSNIPILFISSRDADADKIRAISQGGDDYVEKPFSMDLLTAKIQAMLRRAYSYTDQGLNTLQYQNLILNLDQLQVLHKDKEIELTPNECKILSLLVRNHGNIVTRPRLMKALWDDESFVDDNTLTVNVNRLRRKLESIGLKDFIKTIKGEGYKLK